MSPAASPNELGIVFQVMHFPHSVLKTRTFTLKSDHGRAEDPMCPANGCPHFLLSFQVSLSCFFYSQLLRSALTPLTYALRGALSHLRLYHVCGQSLMDSFDDLDRPALPHGSPRGSHMRRILERASISQLTDVYNKLIQTQGTKHSITVLSTTF